jgi:serine protease
LDLGKESTKENVLNSIRILEKRNDIQYVGPNFIHEIAVNHPVPVPTYYSEQWAINHIQLPDAWNVTTGSNKVKVGVIDTGIDGTHPDLVDRITNELHMDFRGATSVSLLIPVDNDPAYLGGGHGSHVAGIIGANRNYGTPGIIGVCWNVELVSLRIAENGAWFVDNAILAVNYGTSKKLDILNYSGRVRNRAGVINVNDPAFE